MNSHHLLLSSTCCSSHPCRSPWWRTCFHSGLYEMCISLCSAPGLRCKIQLVGRLQYFMWFLHFDLLQEPVEVNTWSKLAALLKPAQQSSRLWGAYPTTSPCSLSSAWKTSTREISDLLNGRTLRNMVKKQNMLKNVDRERWKASHKFKHLPLIP